MKKNYTELIKEFMFKISGNKYERVPEHKVTYEYDTDNIKDWCVICSDFIKDAEKNYIIRGNYCAKCQAEYGKKR